MDTMSRHPGMAGEASIEVSAFSQLHVAEARVPLSVWLKATQSKSETMGLDRRTSGSP